MMLRPSRQRDASVIGISSIDDSWLVNPRDGVGVLAVAGEAYQLQLPFVLSD